MDNTPIIELHDVRIRQQENVVLDQVELTVYKGEFLYLIGRTGSGKSSLMRTLYGDLPLTEGEGHVAGFDLRKLKRGQVPLLRRKIGIVFQDFQLLPDRSVADNLLFVMKATGWKDRQGMERRVEEVLERVVLPNKGYKMPHELSGGEQQRVALARALVGDPSILLADEPTGNLDENTGASIIDLLLGQRARRGCTLVMVTHDLSLAARCDDIVRLHSGTVESVVAAREAAAAS